MKYAHIENGIVTNISNWDGETEYNPGEGITLIQADENAYVGGEYNGSFVARPVEPDVRTYDQKRKAEYPSINELVVALWEGVVEERMASVTKLEGLRQAVKTKYPKD